MTTLIPKYEYPSTSFNRAFNLKLQEIVSVKDFGAVGNGTTDDTVAIQAALDSGSNGIYFPSGSYLISSTLNISSYSYLYGEGYAANPNSTAEPTCSTIVYSGSGIALRANNFQYVAIGNLSITTTYWYKQTSFSPLTYGGTHGIEFYQGADFYVNDCYIEGFGTSGIHLSNEFPGGFIINGYLENNIIYNNGGSGLLVDGSNAANRIYIASNRFSANRQSGISFTVAGNQITIIGNDLEGNAGEINTATNGELHMTGGNCVAVSIIGNYFESSGSTPHPLIRISDTQTTYGLQITGNSLGQAVSYPYAIELTASGGTIEGLVIQANRGGGFTYLVGSANVVLTNALIGQNSLDAASKTLHNVTGKSVLVYSNNDLDTLTYSASITPDCGEGNTFLIPVTDGTAFTINSPINACTGMKRTFIIQNYSSTSTIGTITWNSNYHLASAFTNPAYNYNRSIEFIYNGSTWYEITRVSGDIAN